MAFDFVFLSRQWARDAPQLEKSLQKLAASANPFWLLIFPEGTVLNESTLKRSQYYYAENRPELSHPQHLLAPRATGLKFILDHFDANEL